MSEGDSLRTQHALCLCPSHRVQRCQKARTQHIDIQCEPNLMQRTTHAEFMKVASNSLCVAGVCTVSGARTPVRWENSMWPTEVWVCFAPNVPCPLATPQTCDPTSCMCRMPGAQCVCRQGYRTDCECSWHLSELARF